jgi:hypothetical protein
MITVAAPQDDNDHVENGGVNVSNERISDNSDWPRQDNAEVFGYAEICGDYDAH